MIDQASVAALVAALVPVVYATFSAVIPLADSLLRRGVGPYVACAASYAAAGMAAYVLTLTSEGHILVYKFGGWPPPLGIIYEVDGLGGLMGFAAAALLALCVTFSTSYAEVRGGARTPYYYSLLMLLGAGIVGSFYTGDAFNLFVMMELMAAAAYSLVAYLRDRRLAMEASFKYGITTAVAGMVYFLMLGVIYGYFGTLTMADVGAKVRGAADPLAMISGYVPPPHPSFVALLLSVLMWAFFIESAVFPLHFWLPDAHSEALTPVSAVLSGLVINVGLYAAVRFSATVFNAYSDPSPPIAAVLTGTSVVCSVGAVFASIAMLFQKDVKRLVAYSTVLHVSIMGLGVSLATQLALTAVTYHMLTHSVSKVLAFLSLGMLAHAAGSRRLDRLRGLGRACPGLMVAAVVACMSLAGIPPFATFPSKLLLFIACVGSKCVWGAAALVISSAVSAIAYFKVIHTIWIEKPGDGGGAGGRLKHAVPGRVAGVLAVLSIACIALGVLIPQVAGYASHVSAWVLNFHHYLRAAARALAGWAYGPSG